MRNDIDTQRKSGSVNTTGPEQKTASRSHSTAQNVPSAQQHTNSGGFSAQSEIPSESPSKTHHEAANELHFKQNKHFVLIDHQQSNMTQNVMVQAQRGFGANQTAVPEQSLIQSKPDASRKIAHQVKPVASTQQQNFYMQALKRDFFSSHQQRIGNISSESSSSNPSNTDKVASGYRRPSLPQSDPPKRSQFSGAVEDDRQDASEQSAGILQDMQNRDSEIRMNSTQEAYQPSQDSCGTQEKLDQILEKIMTGNHDQQAASALIKVCPGVRASGALIHHQKPARTPLLANDEKPGSEQSASSIAPPTLGYSETRMRDALSAVAEATNQLQSPFQKCIDKVLSYSELADVRVKQLDKPLPSLAVITLESLPQEMTQMIKSMTFLVKFRGISHLHCQWMPGISIVENFDAQSIQTLIQFLQYVLQNREKPTSVDELGSGQFQGTQSQNIDNNTFLSSFLQSKKVSNFLDIQSATHPFFNPEYIKVEQILCTSTMYPLLHQSGIQQVANSWKDECLRVLDVLLNIQKDSTSFGLKFSAFDPAFGQQDLEQKSDQIDHLFGQNSLQVVNMTQLQNLLYNKGLGRPYQFWANLGKIFKAYMLLDENEQSPNRQFCALLRTMALHLFRKWQQDCTESYQSFMEDLQSTGKRSDDAFSSHQIQANKNRADRHKQQVSNFYQSISGNGARTSNEYQGNGSAPNQLPSMQGAANETEDRDNHEDSSPPKIKLDDLQVFQQILNQNEKILTIQSKLNFTQQDNKEVESLSNTLNLFMENQKLLQNLLLNFQKQHPQLNLYERDLIAARSAKMGTNDEELTNLRNKLLTQNSYALEQLTRRKILGSSDSGSTSHQKSIEKALISGSDSSSLDRPPIFIFNLLQKHQSNQSPKQPTSQESSGNDQANNNDKCNDLAVLGRRDGYPLIMGQKQQLQSQQRKSGDHAEPKQLQQQLMTTNQTSDVLMRDEATMSNPAMNGQNSGKSTFMPPHLQHQRSQVEEAAAGAQEMPQQQQNSNLQTVSNQMANTQQFEKLNAAQTAMEALTTSHAANGGTVSAEFSMLQATIKSFLSQAKQLSSTTSTGGGLAAAAGNQGGNNSTNNLLSSCGIVQRQQSSAESQIAQQQQSSQQTSQQPHQPLQIPLQRQESNLEKQKQPADQIMHVEPTIQQQHLQQQQQLPPVKSVIRHELSWLLFDGETENEILANPYIFEDDVDQLLHGLFKNEQSQQEGDSGQSFDIQYYYLNRPHLQGASKPANSAMQHVRELDSLSFEPLFLVKWKLLSYSEISWEPISALKGDNMRQVKDFLAEKRQISMRGRLINSKMINNQAQLLKVQEELLQSQESVSYAKIFSQQKKILDTFIQSLMRENAAQRSCEEAKSLQDKKNPQEVILKSKNFKLLELQKRSLTSLEQAFFGNKNVVLADQKGLGKRITLINFLSSLKFKHKISGPFLIITTKEKLAHWRYLLDKWTELKTLTYHDMDKGKTGMENLRKWAVYHLDVTIKGRMTTRNQLHKFDVLLTLAEHINNEEEVFLQKVPFMQVIVDSAELSEQREATKRIACKRIICSTSNPMQSKVGNLADLIRCINPKAMDSLISPPERVFGDIASLTQVQSLWAILSPYVIKSFQYELENLFGQLNQIEIDVQMTACQRLFYKEIFEHHGDLLTKVGSLDEFSTTQMAQLEKINDLLLKCCNSVFLIDKDEKLFEKCHQFSKRELKSNLKQQLVSGKMLILQQIVENLQKSSKKMIICSHYPQMLLLLKKYFKETGVACFMFQSLMSIDSVFRFNLYSGQAVFLLHLGQRWTKQECSYFDLDFIQNVVIFDQLGAHENDLINLFQVCTLPFSIDVNIYRLIAENSYEQKLFQRQCRQRKLQNFIFNQRNFWSKNDFISQMRLEFPLQLSTSEECSDYNDISQIPIPELDVLFKLSCEQVVLFLNEHSNNKTNNRGSINNKAGKAPKEQLCFTQNYIELLTQQEKPPQLNVLMDKAKAKNQLRNSDRLMDLHENLKSLDESKVPSMPPLKSANFYYKIFGLDYGASIMKEQTCKHVTCSQFFIDKLSEQSSVVPNQASLVSKTQGQDHFRSFSRTRTRNSNNISLVKLLKIQGQLGRQYKQKTLFSLDFMKQSPSAGNGGGGNTGSGGQQTRGQPVVKIWKNMQGGEQNDLLPEGQLMKVNSLSMTQPVQQPQQHLPGNSQLALISSTPNNGKLLSSINRVRLNAGNMPLDKQAGAHMQAHGNQNEAVAQQQMLVDNTNGVVVGSGPAVVGHNLDTSQGYASGTVGPHGKRKSLSEQGQQDQQQTFNDDEDIKILKAQKKTSENNTNTLKQSLDQQQQQRDGPNEESDDRTIEMQVEDSTGRRSDGLEMAPVEHSSEMNGRPLEQNQPDKRLSNGNVCQICYFLVDDAKQSKMISKEPVLKCEGPCKNYYHGECARSHGLVVPGSIKPIPAKPKLVKALRQSSAAENGSGDDQSQGFRPRRTIVIESFLCQNCNRSQAPCFICKKYDKISAQANPKEKTSSQAANSRYAKNGGKQNMKGKVTKSPTSGCGNHDHDSDVVEKCIVGSCQKYYHFSCLQQNQNVDIYTNNKNQTRFRCPLHYCSGCSISGNSVQILQCVACPTAYHLKCFRADRGAVKLTKKFILCGQHGDLRKKMQRKRNGLGAKNSIAGYSLEQKIEQHKRHYHQLQQMQIRTKQTNHPSMVDHLQHQREGAGQVQQQINTLNRSSSLLLQQQPPLNDHNQVLIAVKQTYSQHHQQDQSAMDNNDIFNQGGAGGQFDQQSPEQLGLRARDLKADIKTLQRQSKHQF